MSVPKILYSETIQEPLLIAPPSKRDVGSSSKQASSSRKAMSSSRTSDFVEVDQTNFSMDETHSFSSEPIHRFGNAAAAQHRRAAAALARSPHPHFPGGDESSEGRLTGGVDGAADPEVAAFANKKRTAGPGYKPPVVQSSSGAYYQSTQLVRSLSPGINSEPGDYVYYKHDKNRTKWEEAAIYIREGEDNDKFFSHPTGRWSKLAYKILHHPIFHVFDLVLSLMLMLLALIEKPAVFGTDSDERPFVTIHGIFECLILILLGVDIVLRLIWLSPKYFIRHRRTMFITLMLGVMFIEAMTVLGRQQSHMRFTRALRPVFFIDTHLMHGVRRVLRQIFQSLKQIVDVLLLLLFVIAFFSLIAYYIFAEADPTYFHSFSRSYVSLFITLTTANNPDVMMEAYSQEKASPLFFIVYLVLTVYFVSNVLLAVVYSNFAEEEKDKFRKLFLHKREALHHAFAVLTGAKGIEFHDFLVFMQQYKPRIPEWQVMCVFKALHVDPTLQHKELSQEEFYDFYEVQNLKWREVTKEGEDVMWFQYFPRNIKRVFEKIHALVKWEWFNSIIYVVIIVNTLFLVIYTLTIHSSQAHDRFRILNIVLPVSFLFLLVYIVEIVLKILALGPFGYFKKFWNICDFFILSLSLITLCLEIDPAYSFLATLRPIKLIRLVRLKRRYRDIMNTLVVLTPRLISITFLLIIIYYFFAILGMEFFHGRVFEGCCENASYGVGEYYANALNDTNVNVYYLNNFDDLLRSYSTLFVLMVVNNWYIIMEGFASEVKHDWAARIYFMAFYIVTLVVLQVVISFIVEAFVLQLEQSNRRKEKKILERQIVVQKPVDDTDCVEDENRKKEVTILLLNEDIAKLKYETTYINELTRGERFSFDRLIRHWRRKRLPTNAQRGMLCSGRRLRTKDDLHLLKFRSTIQQWIAEQDAVFTQVESSTPTPPKNIPFKTRLWHFTKKVLTYFLE